MTIPIILFLLTAVAEAVYLAMRDMLIINFGISIYRLLGYVIYGVFAFAVLTLILAGIKKKKDREIRQSLLKQKEEYTAKKKEKESYLSVKKELDPSEIQYLLNKRNREGEPSFVRQIYGNALHQMQMMDSYQEKLNNLIVANGADGLADSKNILDQCEQYICKNVRKIMNKAELTFSETGIDDPEYRSILDENEKILNKVDDLLHSIVDFLNSQGESDNEIAMLDMYKNTIQDILHEKRR